MIPAAVVGGSIAAFFLLCALVIALTRDLDRHRDPVLATVTVTAEQHLAGLGSMPREIAHDPFDVPGRGTLTTERPTPQGANLVDDDTPAGVATSPDGDSPAAGMVAGETPAQPRDTGDETPAAGTPEPPAGDTRDPGAGSLPEREPAPANRWHGVPAGGTRPRAPAPPPGTRRGTRRPGRRRTPPPPGRGTVAVARPRPVRRRHRRVRRHRSRLGALMPGKHGPLGECWCCGQPGLHKGRGLCMRCYNRWQGRHFTGPGPGPEFTPQAERAREYAHVITSLSARRAAEKLGVSPRTVTRWRTALRAAS